MHNNKLFSFCIKLAVVGIFTCTSNFMQIPESSFAQTHTDRSKSSTKSLELAESQLNIAENSDEIKFIPSDQIDPDKIGRRIPESTFAENPCPTADPSPVYDSPTALIPARDSSNNLDEYNRQIVTEQSNLVLWVYIPYAYRSSNQVRAEFSLEDGNDTDKVYSDLRYKLNNIPGIVKIKSDKNLELKIGKNYHWTLTFTCKATEHRLYGYVKRVKKTSNFPPSTSPEKKLKYYTNLGLWIEALTTLEEIKGQNHNRYEKLMPKLLIQIGLKEEISNQPITEIN